MLSDEKKGITVRIDAELHSEIRQYLEEREMTMAEFITIAAQDELHTKIDLQEEKNMGNMRTLAFQVSEELFQKIKDYLQRNNMTQKEFVIGLIETEIERDLTQRRTESAVHTKTEETEETIEMSDEDSASEEVEEQEEAEDMGMAMNM